MTIQPFQQLLLNGIDKVLIEGGWGKHDLYFDQLTPLVILSDTAEDTDSTIEEAQEDVNDSLKNEETTEENFQEENRFPRPSDFGFSRDYEDFSDEEY